MGAKCLCCRKQLDSPDLKIEYTLEDQKESNHRDAVENENADNGTEPIRILEAAIFLDEESKEESSSKKDQEEIPEDITPEATNSEENGSLLNPKNDILEGYGELTYPDGSVYKGYLHDKLPHGHGVYYNSYRGSTFEGNFVNGMQEGKGTEVYRDKSYYEGDFSQGKRNGKGIFKWPSGKMYSGEFLDDLMHGWGKCQWPKGKEYEGSWVNGSMQDSKDVSMSPDSKYCFKEGQEKEQCNWNDGEIKMFENLIQPEEEQDLSRDSRATFSAAACIEKNGITIDKDIKARVR